MIQVFLCGSHNSRAVEVETDKATKQECVGCQTKDDVINGLCPQCSAWMQIRNYILAIKSLIKKVGN